MAATNSPPGPERCADLPETVHPVPVAFPTSFQRELQAFRDHLAGADLLADEGPAKPLRKSTIVLRRYYVLRPASALVHTGTPPETVDGLAFLVQPDLLKTALRFLLARTGSKVTGQIAGLAATAKSIARHIVRVEPAVVDRIASIVRRVGFNQEGLTEKNRDRLRQFDDDARLDRLLFFAEGALVFFAEYALVELRKASRSWLPEVRSSAR